MNKKLSFEEIALTSGLIEQIEDPLFIFMNCKLMDI